MTKSMVTLFLLLATLLTFAACGAVTPTAETPAIKPPAETTFIKTCQVAKSACVAFLKANPGFVGKTCPTCQTENPDLYVNMHCNGSTGYCTCVDVKTGVSYGKASGPVSKPVCS